MEICHIISGLNQGGAEAILHSLCTCDRVNNHEVITMMDGGTYGPILQNAGITVHCLNMPQGRVTVGGLVRLACLLRRHRPDVVQTWMYHADLIGGLIARLVGIKRVCWGIHHSNLDSGKTKRLTILIAHFCAVLSVVVPKWIVSCSHLAVQVHQSLGYKAKKFVVIPNGYDLIKFRPDLDAGLKFRSMLGITSGTILLGMVARFDPQKDHETLISALEHLKKSDHAFVCILIGNGLTNENAELVALLELYGVRDLVILLGPRNDIPAVMNALDVNVLSSLGEAFPNVLAEALACGTPCVTTDVGDAALIVGKTGWVVQSSNPEALSGAIVAAINEIANQESWTLRKTACRRQVVENFSTERMVEAYRVVWDSSLSGS